MNPATPCLRVVVGLLLLASAACRDEESRATLGEPPRPAGTRVVKVAAVGNSITVGSGLREPERDSYPAQLGRLLGEGYEVRSFGVKGRTMLKKGDYPYWKEAAFDAVQTFNPDIVIIKLGTNDTKPHNWRHKANFAADYEAMIDAFAALPSEPKIWVCLPVPAFGTRGGIRGSVIEGEIIPLIEAIARRKRVPVIDPHAALRARSDLFPDGIHPNAEGARLIAQTVAEAIRAPTARAP